ncbi:SRPBCC family protein [Aquihabitans sp. G128]|uniref:SRPBCC family protein n=1 Tax=Aquihabitans sp. G128 TaxID=2849779 RepID=UPI001C2428D5|nr:SRPBCC family protein [Aquihabitans sp. G128]QXC59611.1 SRPBCC family protein [Aquihabitans sp. G128]
MTERPAGAEPADQVSLHVAAPPERVWELITDVGAMGRLSPECTGGRWLDGATGPVVGARFKGSNKRGIARWSTTNTVVVAEPASAFAWETKQSGVRWRYDLLPEGDGTLVTESRAEFKARPLVAKLFAGAVLGGVDGHEDELRDGMRATLERLKAIAEAG